MRALSRRELQDLDERMIHQYHVPLAVTLEKIAKGAVLLTEERYPYARRAVIVAGSGNTGGVGLILARFLAERGIAVCIILTQHELFLKPTSQRMFSHLHHDTMLGVSPEAHDDELRDVLYSTNVIIDCMVGYPLGRSPEGEVRRLIGLVNESPVPTLAIDVPSGFDADRGPIYGTHIVADSTLMHVLPRSAALSEDTGALYLVDVGVPEAWFRQEEIKPPEYDLRGLYPLR